MSTLVAVFGTAVRQLREARGWSQEQLSEHADLNRSYVGEIERGQVIPSIVTADKLARALGLNVAALLDQCEQIERLRRVQSIKLAAIAC